MSTPSTACLGSFEYELTDELATQGALVLFHLQADRFKEQMTRQGIRRPAVPVTIAAVNLVIGIVAAIAFVDIAFLKWPLVGAAVATLLFLYFRTGPYLSPSLAHWSARRFVRRQIRKLSHRTIRWRFYDDHFETESAAIQRSVPWTELREVKALGGFWFLVLTSGLNLSIPLSLITSNIESIIRRQAVEVRAVIFEATGPNGPRQDE